MNVLPLHGPRLLGMRLSEAPTVLEPGAAGGLAGFLREVADLLEETLGHDYSQRVADAITEARFVADLLMGQEACP